MDRAGSLGFSALLLLCCIAGAAQAHRVQYPKMDALYVAPQGVRLHIEYVVPTAEESALLFRLFDRDHSGTLDDAERQALREHLCRLASAFVAVSLDGQPLPLDRTQADLGTPGGDLLTLSMTLAATVPLTNGTHTLRLLDRHKDRSQAVPVRVSAQGVQLTTTLPPFPILLADVPLQLAFVKTAPTH